MSISSVDDSPHFAGCLFPLDGLWAGACRAKAPALPLTPTACPQRPKAFGHPNKRPFACALSNCTSGPRAAQPLSRSVLDRKFRIKAAQSCHSDCYCSGKRPLCSGKLGRTQGGDPRCQQLARQRWGVTRRDGRSQFRPVRRGWRGSPCLAGRLAEAHTPRLGTGGRMPRLTSTSNSNFPAQCRTFPEQWCSFRTHADV